MPMPSPKKRLSTKGPPEKAQQSPESVPLIQNASEMASPKMKSTSPLRERGAQRVVVGIAVQLGVGEHRLQIGLMRGARDDADLLAFEIFGPDLRHHRVLARGEARRHAVIGIGEVDARAQLRAHRHRGDDGVAPVRGERIDQRLEAAHLHGAGDLDLLAQRAGEIDVEAGRIAVGAGVVERRVVGLGQEADHGQARQVGPLRAPPRVPEAGHGLGGGLAGRGLRRGLRRRGGLLGRGLRACAGQAREQAARDGQPRQQATGRFGRFRLLRWSHRPEMNEFRWDRRAL